MSTRDYSVYCSKPRSGRRGIEEGRSLGNQAKKRHGKSGFEAAFWSVCQSSVFDPKSNSSIVGRRGVKALSRLVYSMRGTASKASNFDCHDFIPDHLRIVGAHQH